ncbi:MAG: endolytic transglycosylase MltG, partial [Patescibacteria group bacterium]
MTIRSVSFFIFLILTVGGVIFLSALRPVAWPYLAEAKKIDIQSGMGLREISAGLKASGLIHSRLAFNMIAVATGNASKLKPGKYTLSSGNSSWTILNYLVLGADPEVEIKIPDGASVYQIDGILSEADVLSPGQLIAYTKSSKSKLEGHLFPDTYRFFTSSTAEEVIAKFLENFDQKAKPLFGNTTGVLEKELTLASLVEKEVPVFSDRQIVAGVFEKRLRENMPLQVDASVCYVKQVRAGK